LVLLADKANKYSFLDEDSSDSSFSESHFIKKNYSQKGSENKESAKQLSVGARCVKTSCKIQFNVFYKEFQCGPCDV